MDTQEIMNITYIPSIDKDQVDNLSVRYQRQSRPQQIPTPKKILEQTIEEYLVSLAVENKAGITIDYKGLTTVWDRKLDGPKLAKLFAKIGESVEREFDCEFVLRLDRRTQTVSVYREDLPIVQRIN